MIRLGVMGYGYWGPNLVRNFMETDDVKVEAVCDLLPENLKKAQKRYPHLRVTSDTGAFLKDPGIDAVAISTPVFTHFDLCMKAFQAGKHVFVEKPLTYSSDEAVQLIEEARKRNLVLFVDHTFIYTGAVRKIKEMMEKNALGKIYYYDSTRVNLGLFQHDVNVLWDLAVHDLSIMDHLLKEKPVAVSATGMSHIQGKPANLAYLTCFFSNNLIAHVNVNWLAPAKVRKTLIGGDKKMIVYDDLEVTEKVKVYDKGVALNDEKQNLYRSLIDYRLGDMEAPHIDSSEALRYEADCFARCIKGENASLSNGEAGLRIVHLLEAASRSLGAQGQLVQLNWKAMGL